MTAMKGLAPLNAKASRRRAKQIKRRIKESKENQDNKVKKK